MHFVEIANTFVETSLVIANKICWSFHPQGYLEPQLRGVEFLQRKNIFWKNLSEKQFNNIVQKLEAKSGSIISNLFKCVQSFSLWVLWGPNLFKSKSTLQDCPDWKI